MLKALFYVVLALLALAGGSIVMIAGSPLVVVAVVCILMLLGVIALAVIIATPNQFIAAIVATARGVSRRLEVHFYHRRHGRHVDRRELMTKYLNGIGIGHHSIGIGPVVRQ